MYYCSRSRCRARCLPNNRSIDFSEIKKPFDTLYILSCGHCLCEKCLYITVQADERSYKCDQCGSRTSISARAFSAIKSAQLSNTKRINRLNEDCPTELPIDAYSFGIAFNHGQVMALPVETITLDEDQLVLTPEEKMKQSEDSVDTENALLREAIPKAGRSRFAPLIHAMYNGLTIHAQCGKSLKVLGGLERDLSKELFMAKLRLREKFHHLHSLLQLEEMKGLTLLENKYNQRKEQFAEIESQVISLRRKIKDLFYYDHDTMENLTKKRNELKNAILKPSGINILNYEPKADFAFDFDDGISNLLKHTLSIEDLPERPVIEITYVNVESRSLPPKTCLSSPSSTKSGTGGYSITNSPPGLTDLYQDEATTSSQSSDIIISSPGPVESSSSRVPVVGSISSQSRRSPSPVHSFTPISFSISGFREEIVKLSKIHTPELFYVTLYNNPEKISRMEKHIETWCCSSFNHPPPRGAIKVNGHCFAFSDLIKRWCRARLVSINSTFEAAPYSKRKKQDNIISSAFNSRSKSVDVELFDYGETERLPYTNLRLPFEELFDQEIYPYLAMKCSLHGIKPRGEEWSERAITSFRNYCSTRRLILLIKEVIGDTHYVDLMQYDLDDVAINNASLREALVFCNEARLQLNEVDEVRFTTNPIVTFRKPELLSNSKIESVLVTEMQSPDLFYVTLYYQQEKFHSFHERLKIYFDLPEEPYTLYCPKKNMPCIALDNGTFYRALIRSVIDAETVQIEFVDFGYTKVIPSSNLRLIRGEFLRLPIQAIPCKLGDIAPLGGFKWPQNSIDKFRELLFGDPCDNSHIFNLTVFGYEANNKHIVNLRRYTGTEFISVNMAMVNLKCAISTGPTTEQSEAESSLNIVDYQDPSSRFDSRVFTALQGFDVCGYNILKELVARNREAKSSKIDSLIKIRLSHWVGPSEFYVQITTPEVRSYFVCYENKLADDNVDRINDRIPPFQDPISPKEPVIYFIKEEFSTTWRRAIVIGRKSEHDSDSDSPDTLYNLYARDYGFSALVQRKFILQPPSDSIYLKDGDFCIKCHLSDLAPAGGGTWTRTAIEEFSALLKKYKNNLYLHVPEKYLQSDQPESVSVDLYAKEITIADALAPKKIKFHSFKSLLVNHGIAVPLRGLSLSEDEEEPTTSNYHEKLNMPVSLRSRSSIISFLKNGHNRGTEIDPAAVHFYKDPVRPNNENFIAIPTEVEDKMKIWFRVYALEGGQLIDTINRSISKALRERDELTPFAGETILGRACTAYFKHDKTWNRAEILYPHGDDEFVIRYIDYGNMDKVTKENLSSDVFHLEIPKLALFGFLANCRPLINEEEEEDTLRDAIHGLTVDKKCVVYWENYESTSEMKISIVCPDGTNLKEILLDKRYVEEDFSDEQDAPIELRSIREHLLASEFNQSTTSFKPNVYYPVVLTGNFFNNYVFFQPLSIDHPQDDIEHSINSKNDAFLDALIRMREEVDSFALSTTFSSGEGVAAQFTDGDWYRAMIISTVIPEHKYKVFYVDYGNFDILETEKLRKLPIRFIRYPQTHALLGKAFNIRPTKGGGWTKRLLRRMEKTAELHHADTLALFKNNKSPWDFELFIADPEAIRVPHQSLFQPFVDIGELILTNSEDDDD